MLAIELENLLDFAPENPNPESLYITNGVSWTQYETFLNKLGDSLKFRVKYLDGVLEVMSPSRNHERIKSMIGQLLEVYFEEKNILTYPTGSMTLKNQAKKGGLEPDESYCLYSDKEYPDLAIEVIVTSGGLDRLKIYQRLGVQEVWFWENETISIYYLTENNEYQLVRESGLLPELNLEVFLDCLSLNNTLESVKTFRKYLQEN
jgi:Uma2 family endonuclease